MNLRVISTILRKELLDTLRDKRTLLMMIGVPIVLYPAMLIIMLQVALLQHEKLDKAISKVAIAGEGRDTVKEWLKDAEKLEIIESEDPEGDLGLRKLDAIVAADIAPRQRLDEGGSVPIGIRYDQTELASRDAKGRIETALEEVAERFQAERLVRLGLEKDYIEPLAIESTDVATSNKTTGTVLGLILPMLMVIMIALGAFYPAVDMTAGEKERGTFETLLSTPVSKLEIVTGKFLGVFLLSMLTGLLNIASMGITFVFLMSQAMGDLPKVQEFSFQLPFSAVLLMILVMGLLGVLISALMMSVAVFANSFKEAQNYVTPFFIVIAVPAMLAAMPGTELSGFTQFVPIYNAILLFKDMMVDKAGAESIAAVIASTGAWALLSLLFAAWLFQREEVVLSEEHGIPLSFHRADFRARASLTPGSALGLYALSLIALLYGGSLVQGWRLLEGLIITEYLIMLVPCLGYLWFTRVRLRTALYLRVPRPAAFLGALLAGLGAMVLLMQAGLYQNRYLPVPKEFEAEMMRLFALDNVPGGIYTLLFAVALSPAICEEVLMRGAVLSGLRTRLRPWAAILLVGFLFGVLHLSVYRVLPTALLGMLLTYCVLRTGSLLTSVVMHFINNALGILLMTEKLPGFMTRSLDLKGMETNGVPGVFLAGAVVALGLGIFIVEWSSRGRAAKAIAAERDGG